MKLSNILCASLPLVATVLLSGCGAPASTAPATSGSASQEPVHADHGDGPSAEVAEQLAKLAPEDRAAAEKQKICLVSDEPLGSMGVPPKVSLNGREVFICCKGCEEELVQNADTYLAKLPKD